MIERFGSNTGCCGSTASSPPAPRTGGCAWPGGERLPEPLDHVELWAVTGQPLQLQVRVLDQHGLDDLTGMPRGVVDDQDHARVLPGGVTAADLAEVLGERPLEAASLALPVRRYRPVRHATVLV